MFYLALVILIAFFIRCMVFFYFYQKQFFLQRPLRRANKIFQNLYSSICGKSIAQAECKRLQLQDDSFVYGEITLESLHEIFQRTPFTENDIFYDLGCGTGKAVIGAALLRKFKKCCGIDLLPGLIESAIQVKNSAATYAHTFVTPLTAIEFHHQDLLNVDLSQAGIVFIHATTFHPTLWEPLIKKLNCLKENTYIIAVTKKLSSNQFETINALTVSMSWGEGSVYIYRKK